MSLFNCHTHTCYSHDGKGSVNEICLSASEQNIFGFAVTDHCDCEYSSDSSIPEKLTCSYNEAKNCQKIYENRLVISCGIEIGEALFNPNFANKIISSHNWDMVLGSVHAVRMKDLDMPFSVIDFSDFDDKLINRYVTQYFDDMLEMTQTQDFDVLTHLTVVLRYIVYKYNKNVELKSFYPVIKEILKKVISFDKTLEVNTSGLINGYMMPDTEIIRIYKSLGGKRITVGSDAHTPEMLTSGLDSGAKIIKALGFDTLTYYMERKPVEYKI